MLATHLVTCLTAKQGNELRATGHQDPFSTVFFTDGTDPTAAPHTLPPLHNIDGIRALTLTDLRTHCINYGLSHQGNVDTRQRRIARHIGFYDDLYAVDGRRTLLYFLRLPIEPNSVRASGDFSETYFGRQFGPAV